MELLYFRSILANKEFQNCKIWQNTCPLRVYQLVLQFDMFPVFDFYKNKYQRNRVSMVGRAAEILFTLPNDLQYLKNYSQFYIDNLDFIVKKDSIIDGNLSVGTLGVGNTAHVGDKLTVKSHALIEGNLSVKGSNSVIEGSLTINGDLTVDNVNRVDITIVELLKIGGTLSVFGKSNIDNSLEHKMLNSESQEKQSNIYLSYILSSRSF